VDDLTPKEIEDSAEAAACRVARLLRDMYRAGTDRAVVRDGPCAIAITLSEEATTGIEAWAVEQGLEEWP
jgi:hypothetical protein